MHGMFKSNGGCGYVKKPDFLLETGLHNEVFDPKAKLPVKLTLKVSALLPRFRLFSISLSLSYNPFIVLSLLTDR